MAAVSLGDRTFHRRGSTGVVLSRNSSVTYPDGMASARRCHGVSGFSLRMPARGTPLYYDAYDSRSRPVDFPPIPVAVDGNSSCTGAQARARTDAGGPRLYACIERGVLFTASCRSCSLHFIQFVPFEVASSAGCRFVSGLLLSKESSVTASIHLA
jgi:hypothetical protein